MVGCSSTKLLFHLIAPPISCRVARYRPSKRFGYRTTGDVQLAIWRVTGHRQRQLLIACEPELSGVGLLDRPARQAMDTAAEQTQIATSSVSFPPTVGCARRYKVSRQCHGCAVA